MMLFFAEMKQPCNWKMCYDSSVSHNNFALANFLYKFRNLFNSLELYKTTTKQSINDIKPNINT